MPLGVLPNANAADYYVGAGAAQQPMAEPQPLMSPRFSTSASGSVNQSLAGGVSAEGSGSGTVWLVLLAALAFVLFHWERGGGA
jgi:hypothetical protein